MKIGAGILKNYSINFNKVSNDGSGKCDDKYTSDPDNIVYGVVYDIPSADKPLLERKEGLGYGYVEKYVSIELMDRKIINAFTYLATSKDPSVKPYDWYKEHVVRGAMENNLPEEYIKDIESHEANQDDDEERSNKELSIYE